MHCTINFIPYPNTIKGHNHYYTIKVNGVYQGSLYIKGNMCILNPDMSTNKVTITRSKLRKAIITRYKRSFMRFDKAERIARSLASLRRHIIKVNPDLCEFIGVSNTAVYRRNSVIIHNKIKEEM